MMEDKQVYSDIGRLGAQIEGLTQVISEMKSEDKEHRDYVKAKLQVLEKVEADLNIASPVLKDINKWKERTIGAVMAASAASAVVSAYGGDIINFIRFKMGW